MNNKNPLNENENLTTSQDDVVENEVKQEDDTGKQIPVQNEIIDDSDNEALENEYIEAEIVSDDEASEVFITQNEQGNVEHTEYPQQIRKVATPKNSKTKSKVGLIVFGAIAAFIVTVGASAYLTFYMLNGNISTSVNGTVQQIDGPTITLKQSEKSDTTLPQGSNVKLTVPQIASKVNPSVVGIKTDSVSQNSSQSGTGIIMSEDGYIVTNNHVIEGGDLLTVVLEDGKQYTARLIGADAKTDLAVIKIDPDAGQNLVAAEFGDSNALVVGDTAIAIGNPGGLELQGTLTGGYISAINRDIVVDDRVMTLIQTDASINPGNSGGPLINEYGQVIGINTIKISASNYEGLGFAIPINEVKPIVDELISYGYVKGRPSIGISGQSISKEFAFYNNVPQGLLVSSVDTRSDAYKKGLKAGDIITGVNGTETASISEINKIKDGFKAGEQITLNVYRSGKTIDIKITLMDEKELENSTQQNNSSNSNNSNNSGNSGNGGYNGYFPFFSFD